MTADLLTTDEVAEMLRTSPSTVRQWRHAGTGPQGVKVGKRVLYRADEVTRWLTELETRERRTHMRSA
jgi:excisionase family DNA binding protein